MKLPVFCVLIVLILIKLHTITAESSIPFIYNKIDRLTTDSVRTPISNADCKQLVLSNLLINSANMLIERKETPNKGQLPAIFLRDIN